ncbi:MAG: DinB family protein [Nocardioides sp.]
MAYDGMFVAPDVDPRNNTVSAVGELATYRDYLDNYRTTLRLKCADLTWEQLVLRAIAPSDLSLLGMVQHMARVEHHWFQRYLRGLDVPRLYDDGTGGFTDLGPSDAAWTAFEEQVRLANEALDEFGGDLGEIKPVPGHPDESASVRDVLVHMIEEYARHLGHVDLLREVIDGRTGL